MTLPGGRRGRRNTMPPCNRDIDECHLRIFSIKLSRSYPQAASRIRNRMQNGRHVHLSTGASPREPWKRDEKIASLCQLCDATMTTNHSFAGQHTSAFFYVELHKLIGCARLPFTYAVAMTHNAAAFVKTSCTRPCKRIALPYEVWCWSELGLAHTRPESSRQGSVRRC